MKIIVGLMLGVAVAASADTGDRNYLHHGVLERTLVGAAMKNPATWYERGAGVENAFIAMTAEEVVITLHAERAEVAATFYFENTAAEPRDVEMCFPVTYGMLGVDSYAARDEEFSIAGLKTDLAVAVDGAAAPYALEDTSDVWEFPALANWAVHFDAGERRRVVCHYTDDYNGYGGSLDSSVV